MFQYADPLEGRATIVASRNSAGGGGGGGANVESMGGNAGHDAADARSNNLVSVIPAAPATGGLKAMEIGNYRVPTPRDREQPQGAMGSYIFVSIDGFGFGQRLRWIWIRWHCLGRLILRQHMQQRSILSWAILFYLEFEEAER